MIIIHGHRGSRGTHPENIIASFEEARDAGAQFIELDVHLSKDGKAVVYHDFDISSKLCLNSLGQSIPIALPIRELTLAEIKTFEVGTLTLREFPQQKAVPRAHIPSLEEVMLWKLGQAPGLALNIEIKPSSEALAHEVVRLLEKYGLIQGTLVQSFQHEVVRAARKLAPGLRLSCLFEEAADFAKVAAENRAEVAAVHFPLLTAEQVQRCHEAGIDVLPWTVNDPVEWERLLGLGVKSLITDYPRRLRAWDKA